MRCRSMLFHPPPASPLPARSQPDVAPVPEGHTTVTVRCFRRLAVWQRLSNSGVATTQPQADTRTCRACQETWALRAVRGIPDPYWLPLHNVLLGQAACRQRAHQYQAPTHPATQVPVWQATSHPPLSSVTSSMRPAAVSCCSLNGTRAIQGMTPEPCQQAAGNTRSRHVETTCFSRTGSQLQETRYTGRTCHLCQARCHMAACAVTSLERPHNCTQHTK